MIVVRVSQGIVDHFPIRVSEWISTYAILGWGWVLCLDPQTFDKSVSFTELARWGDERTWGAICIIAASFRLVALVINGTFKEHFRYSPHLRGISTLVACTVWGQVTLGILVSYQSSGGVATGLIAYSSFMLLDLWNLFRAWSDVGAAAKARVLD